MIGGSSTSVEFERTVEAYYPGMDAWSTKEDMPTGRKSLATAVVDGVIYAYGGRSDFKLFEKANEAYFQSLFLYLKD